MEVMLVVLVVVVLLQSRLAGRWQLAGAVAALILGYLGADLWQPFAKGRDLVAAGAALLGSGLLLSMKRPRSPGLFNIWGALVLGLLFWRQADRLVVNAAAAVLTLLSAGQIWRQYRHAAKPE
jgi:hypothetical protein